MFNNVGNKLQILAWITCILGIIGSVIGGINCIISGNSIIINEYSSGPEIDAGEQLITEGIVLLIAGPIASWIGSLSTYALGQVAENSETQMNYLNNISNKLNNLSNNQQNSSAAPVSAPAPTQQQLTDVLRNANNKISAPPATKPNPISEEPTLSLDDKTKEATYYYAVQMYKQGKNEIAYNAFLKITGYKDSDKYIEELNK